MKKSTIKELLDCKVAGKLSGATAANRLNYQQAWSLLKIIHIHNDRSDYRAVFDFAEDFILYCDSTEDPGSGEFYQVKTDKTKKSFSIGDLTKARVIRKKTELVDSLKKSFLEKLFDNKVLFPGVEARLFFISNIPFNFDLQDITKDSKKLTNIQITEIKSTELEKLFSKVGETYSLEDYKGTIFEVSSLSLDQGEREKIIKADLMDLIEKKYPGKPYQAGPILKALISEVIIKSNYENDLNDVKLFFEKKTISKEKFASFLEKGLDLTSGIDKWLQIQPLLVADGLGSGEILELKTAYYQLVERYIEDSQAVLEENKKIKSILGNISRKGKKLTEIVEECVHEYNKGFTSMSNPLGDNFIRAMVLDEAV